MSIKTTIRDFLKEETDIDVIDDVTDDLWIAFDGPVKLTEAGEKRFGSVLDLEVVYRNGWGGMVACVLLDGRSDWEDLERVCIDLFESLAGYCSEREYKLWFEDCNT